MVLFKRKLVPILSPPPLIPDDAEIWLIPETEEMFLSYEAYLQRNDFYRQKRFICEITGHSNLTYREALTSEMEARGELAYVFPEQLREPILRRVHFCQISRIDYLVDWIFDEFKSDFYPGEKVLLQVDEERLTGIIKSKTKFPELRSAGGFLEREAFNRYFCHIEQQPGREVQLNEAQISRDKHVFTKHRLRSFLKTSFSRETWAGAPWVLKQNLADELRLSTVVPEYLTQEYQLKLRRALLQHHKRAEQEQAKLAKKKGGNSHHAKLKEKKHNVKDDHFQLEFTKFLQEQHVLGRLPTRLAPSLQDLPAGLPLPKGFQPPPGKGSTKQEQLPTPVGPKYPIEDLEIPPLRDGTQRPSLKYLNAQIESNGDNASKSRTTIDYTSVGPLLETWTTLNVYCEVFHLDSFTFDDYVEALQYSTSNNCCELLIEIHCAVLKRLVNASNDQAGQVQFQLPEQETEEEEDDAEDQVMVDVDAGVSDVPKRATRSSLLQAEAMQLVADAKLEAEQDNRIHRAAEMDQYDENMDWKTRLQKREFENGGWVVILVGLLYQLSLDIRTGNSLDPILAHLAPLDLEPSPQTAYDQYQCMNVNLRVQILQLLCIRTLETKAIKNYMEDCSNLMTEHRKERNELKRNWKTAVEEHRQLEIESKALQPENNLPSPEPENQDPVEDIAPEQDNEEQQIRASDESANFSEEDVRPSRSLRRGQERALARHRATEEDRGRKGIAILEKSKKISKEEREHQKVLTKIEKVTEQIKIYEEEIASVDNDLRESDCPRTRVLGRDRFWNRYYWMERNAMPYGGLPASSTAHAGYSNGCIWVQGPDDLERMGFIELSEHENRVYESAFQMTVPERRALEEGETHLPTAWHWGYYDEPDSIDMLIGWLDTRGNREGKLRRELLQLRDTVTEYMRKRQAYTMPNDMDEDAELPSKRMSTRTKHHQDSRPYRFREWHNLTALRELGHLHSEPIRETGPRKQRGVAMKKVRDSVAAEVAQSKDDAKEIGALMNGRQTRGAASSRQVSGTGVKKNVASRGGKLSSRKASSTV